MPAHQHRRCAGDTVQVIQLQSASAVRLAHISAMEVSSNWDTMGYPKIKNIFFSIKNNGVEVPHCYRPETRRFGR